MNIKNHKSNAWLNHISKRYIWPKHSKGLRKRILMQTLPNSAKKESILSFFNDSWKPMSALASALLLGIYIGQSPSIQNTNDQSNLYMDQDIKLIQSIAIKYESKGF